MSKTNELIKCLECGKLFLRVTNTHLQGCCGLSISEYREKHNGAKIESSALAYRRVERLRGNTYEQIIGEERGIELKERRSEDMLRIWEEDPKRRRIREGAKKKAEEALKKKIELPALIGRPRKPERHESSICENCGIEFDYYTNDRSGIFCGVSCYHDFSRRNSNDYRIKAFAHFPVVCDVCGELEKALIVHHKDRNPLNNDIANLQILCNPCHFSEHFIDRVRLRREWDGISEAGIRRGVIEILKALRVDIRDENFCDTPRRVAKSFMEIFEGLLESSHSEIQTDLSTTFPCDYDEMVVVSGIDCWGMCPHHLLPVRYDVAIGYIPNNRVLGLSKLPRLANLLARRPVLQEQLTKDISDHLMKCVDPKGVIVKIEGSHSCMQMRGIKSQHAMMVTSSVTGVFKEQSEVRSEFFSLIGGSRGFSRT